MSARGRGWRGHYQKPPGPEPHLLSGKHATHKGWEPYSGLIETHVGQVHMPATSPGQAGGCPAHVPGGENTHTKHTRGHTHGHTWAHMQTMVMHRHTQGLSRGDTWGHMRHTWTHNIHGDTYQRTHTDTRAICGSSHARLPTTPKSVFIH